MNTKKSFNDVLVVGMALFAMFFGAGNLIFPPAMGLAAGKSFTAAMAGFFLTGIGMPLLGIIAVSKAGGTVRDLSDKVNPTFGKILSTIVILAIGPLLAIPRTGATTFEMGIRPLLPSVSPILVSVVYFSIALFLVINPTGVVDKIGKILTPVLVAVLAYIIYSGITSPIGAPGTIHIENPFSKGFTEGYQTMDAIGSIVFGGIVMNALIEKGYKDKKDQMIMTIKAGMIAALGLAFVYGGLMYLGATGGDIFPVETEKTALIVGIVEKILGRAGIVAIAVCVSAACLTTTVGLVATVGEYFQDLSGGKWSYRNIVIITTIFSAIAATMGVEKIVSVAVPLLVTVYPVVIVLIVMNVFDNFIKNKGAYTGAVYGALFVSFFDALSVVGINTSFIGSALGKLPLAAQGFGWLVPALIGAMITSFLMKNQNVEA